MVGYDEPVAENNLEWQSKLILLLVLPYCAVSMVLQAQNWIRNVPETVVWALGLSALLGLTAWKMRSATPAAAATGALLTATLTFSTLVFPYRPWKTGLVPVLAVLLLTGLATRFGHRHKVRLGTAEKKHGRGAAQVAANVGLAAVLIDPTVQSALATVYVNNAVSTACFLTLGLAALAEAAADTVSSELGQVIGGTPRMLTTLRKVEPGTDGGVTLAGTAAGMAAAAIVAFAGTLALHGGPLTFALSWAAAVFGLLFDSLLGATLERNGWLNNDAVNFLSTASAAAFAMIILLLTHATW